MKLKDIIPHIFLYNNTHNYIPKYINENGIESVIDIGAGTGVHGYFIKTKTKAKYYGYEPYPNTVRSVPTDQTTITYKKYPKGKYELCLMINVIEHMTLDELETHIKRLKKNGMRYIIIRTNNPSNILSHLDFYNCPDHIRMWGKKALKIIFNYYGYVLMDYKLEELGSVHILTFGYPTYWNKGID